MVCFQVRRGRRLGTAPQHLPDSAARTSSGAAVPALDLLPLSIPPLSAPNTQYPTPHTSPLPHPHPHPTPPAGRGVCVGGGVGRPAGGAAGHAGGRLPRVPPPHTGLRPRGPPLAEGAARPRAGEQGVGPVVWLAGRLTGGLAGCVAGDQGRLQVSVLQQRSKPSWPPAHEGGLPLPTETRAGTQALLRRAPFHQSQSPPPPSPLPLPRRPCAAAAAASGCPLPAPPWTT